MVSWARRRYFGRGSRTRRAAPWSTRCGSAPLGGPLGAPCARGAIRRAPRRGVALLCGRAVLGRLGPSQGGGTQSRAVLGLGPVPPWREPQRRDQAAILGGLPARWARLP